MVDEAALKFIPVPPAPWLGQIPEAEGKFGTSIIWTASRLLALDHRECQFA